MRHKTLIPWLVGLLVGILLLSYVLTGPPAPSAPSAADTAQEHFQRAKALQSEGKFQEALPAFRLFLSQPGSDASPDLLRKQGEATLFLLPYQSEAENQALIQRISQKLDGHPALQRQFYFRLSLYYDSANQIDPALGYAQKVIALIESPAPQGTRSPLNFDAYFRLGRLLEKSGDFPAAEATFQKIIAAPTGHSWRARLNSTFQLANLYIRLHRNEAANRLLRSVEEAVGPTPAALIFYCRLYHFNIMYNRPAEAERCYNKCLELGGRLPELKSLKYDAGAEAMENYRLALLSHFFLGQLFQERQDIPRAIQEFEQIVTYPTLPPMRMRWVQSAAALLSLYERAGHSKETVEVFIQQSLSPLADRPRLLALFLHHVTGYYERQKQPGAVKIYAQRLLEVARLLPPGLYPKAAQWQATAYFRLAGIGAAAGNRTQAADYYYKVLLAPCDGPYLFKSQTESAVQLVGLYSQMGRASEVDKVFQDATRKVEEYLQADAVRARPLYERNKAEFLKIAVDFYYWAAQHYDKTGQKKIAERYLQNILQLKSRNP